MKEPSFVDSSAVRRHFERRFMRFGLAMLFQVVVLVSVPIIAGAWLGRGLDERHGSGPLWLIVCLLLMAGVAAFLVYRRSRDWISRYRELAREEQAALEQLES
jgi:F0F1-type ATP synthase assembly protein I